MKKHYSIYYLLLLFLAAPVFGQSLDPAQILLTSKKYYEEKSSVNLSLIYKLYDAPSGGKIVDEIKGQYIKNAQGVFSSYGSMYIYDTEKWYWVVDEQSKTIYIKDKQNKTNKATPSTETHAPDAIVNYLKLYKNVKAISITENESKVSLSEPLSPYSQFKNVSVWISKTGSVNKLELIYHTTLKQMGITEEDKAPRLLVEYTASQQVVPADLLDYKKYYSSSNQQFKGVGKYQTYTIQKF